MEPQGPHAVPHERSCEMRGADYTAHGDIIEGSLKNYKNSVFFQSPAFCSTISTKCILPTREAYFWSLRALRDHLASASVKCEAQIIRLMAI